MKRNYFLIGIIAFVVVSSLLVSNHITSAQRLNAQANDKPTMVVQSTASSTVIVANSWLTLSFKLDIDSETLAKAHPIYQKAYNDMEAQDAEIDNKYAIQMNELRTNPPVDRRLGQQRAKTLLSQIAKEKRDISKNGMDAITSSLQKILSETQMSKLHEQTEELLKQRMRAMPPPNARGKLPQGSLQ